jgi:phage portal protein BeeE
MIQKYKFTTDDFKSGRFDTEFGDAVQGLNIYNDSTWEFTPIRSNGRWQNEYEKIIRGFPQLPYIISSWQSNIGANDSTVVIDINENNSPSVQARKKNIQKRVYNLIYQKHHWKLLELQIIEKIAKEGNAVLLLNQDNQLIVESISRYAVYWDNQNKKARYSYLVDGREKEGMTNLEHGVDLWHFRDPIFSSYPVAPSRLQVAMAMILLENKATRLNTHMFANGWLSNIFLKFKDGGESAVMDKLNDPTKDKENKTWKDRIMDIFNSKSRGVENAGKVGIIPFLEDLIRVSVTNKDSQYLEMMKTLTPERVAWAFSMTITDFGTGGATTYNNVATFNDALYDKFGRPVEQLLDEARNEFVLPLEGITTTDNFYIHYNEPEDPNKLLEVKEKREDWKNDAMTLNEYREVRGLPPLPDGDVTFSSWTGSKLQEPDPKVVDAVTEKVKSNNCLDHDHDLVDFSKKKETPTEKALKTEEYDKFLARWNKSITKQIKTFLDGFSEVKDSELTDFEVKLPKIESFYAFNVLKKDLLQFAGMGLDTFKKDKRIKFKAEFFDGEYPQVVLDAIDQRTEMLLKGVGDYKGVDAETTRLINMYIKDNASKGVFQITKLLTEMLPEFSQNRAELIAMTEVAEAVEGTRETMYLEGFPDGYKEWQTAVFDVCPICVENEKQGKISIKDNHQSGHSRPTAHPRCGCTELYFPD